jgi:hypothetical protein
MKHRSRPARGALLFVTPWVGEIWCINGQAVISNDPALRKRRTFRGAAPRMGIVVTADRAHFQCPKALVRSDSLYSSIYIGQKSLPGIGTILADTGDGTVSGEYSRANPEALDTGFH